MKTKVIVSVGDVEYKGDMTDLERIDYLSVSISRLLSHFINKHNQFPFIGQIVGVNDVWFFEVTYVSYIIDNAWGVNDYLKSLEEGTPVKKHSCDGKFVFEDKPCVVVELKEVKS